MIGKKLFKITLLLIFTLICLELLLQLGALIVKVPRRDVPNEWSTSNTHVLALGDSNTFGLYLDESESYPAQLEKMWNSRHPDNPIEVINLGYPGVSSFKIAETLDDVIESFRPEVVLLTIGVNDIFTAAKYIEGGGNKGGIWNSLVSLRHYSRVYKLIYMARQGLSSDDVEDVATGEGSETMTKYDYNREGLEWSDNYIERQVKLAEFKIANGAEEEGREKLRKLNEAIIAADNTSGGEKAIDLPKKSKDERGFHYLRSNLDSIETRIQASGAKMYLLDYAATASYYEKVNRHIRRYAKENPRTKFIDVALQFQQFCPVSADCEDLFFTDFHPTASGYGKVATIIIENLEFDQAGVSGL